jgi:hypothetical protein
MQPDEALGIAAQVAVTLAGFAGVVVVFRPDSVHRWSQLDRFRLRLLLASSISPLVYAFFGILLLTIEPPPDSIWRWCSAFAIVFQLPFVIVNLKIARSLPRAEFKGISKSLFVSLGVLGIAAWIFQFYNIAVLNWFWPFFALIFIHLIAAILQFMRLVLLPPKSDSALPKAQR